MLNNTRNMSNITDWLLMVSWGCHQGGDVFDKKVGCPTSTRTVHLESRCRLKFYFQRYWWAEITSTCSWDQAEQESIVVLPVLCSWVESGGAEMIPLWSWFCRKEYEVTRKMVLPARFLMWKQVWSIKKQGRLVKKTNSQAAFFFASLPVFSFREFISHQP